MPEILTREEREAARAAERDTRAELEQCMADGRKRTDEVARLQDQVAAHIEGTWPAGDLRRAFVAGASWWEYRSTNATMWPSDRRLAEAAAEQRYPAGQLCALAGAGEEKPA